MVETAWKNGIRTAGGIGGWWLRWFWRGVREEVGYGLGRCGGNRMDKFELVTKATESKPREVKGQRKQVQQYGSR